MEKPGKAARCRKSGAIRAGARAAIHPDYRKPSRQVSGSIRICTPLFGKLDIRFEVSAIRLRSVEINGAGSIDADRIDGESGGMEIDEGTVELEGVSALSASDFTFA